MQHPTKLYINYLKLIFIFEKNVYLKKKRFNVIHAAFDSYQCS